MPYFFFKKCINVEVPVWTDLDGPMHACTYIKDVMTTMFCSGQEGLTKVEAII